MGCHALLQGIFPTEGLNLGLPHCRQILYQLSHQGICALSGYWASLCLYLGCVCVCVCVYFFVRPKTKPTSFMASDHPPCCPSWWLSFLPPPLLLPMTLFLSPASPGCFLACHDFSDWHWVSDSCSPKPSPQTHPVLNSRPPAALWPPLKHAECLL